MSETKEDIKKRIDTNKNQYIENDEIDNFIKDKDNGEDINILGEYLNNLPLYNNDELKKALNNFFISPERNKYDQEIRNKVRNNQPLNRSELSLMYLAMISDPNTHLSSEQQLKFDSNKPIDQICNGALIFFIRTKYNSPGYMIKVEIKEPDQPKEEKNNPIGKIEGNKGGDINLPDNIREIKESEIPLECNRLITRAERTFPNDISKAKREIEERHRYKDEEEKKAYIKRDTLLIAFTKYTEAIGKKNERLIKSSGYKDKEDFEGQMKLLEEFGEEIKNKYPNIDEIMSKLKKFDEEMKSNEKKYFKNENETKKAEENYKEFNEYVEKKTKEYNIEETEKSLKKDPETKEEAELYLHNINKIYAFQEDITEKNKTYGDSITKYNKYVKGAIDIQKEYNIQQYQDILEEYNQDISEWDKKIDFKKYENYRNGMDRKLEVGLKNINTLEGIITDPENEYFPIQEIKDIERKKQIKQEGIDRIREKIKNFSPDIYWTLTTFAGLWNGLIDATVGAGTSLGVMILGIIGGKDETLAQMDRKEKRDNFLKIGQSSTQKESVYDSETGFNFHVDNTVSTVASSISQMLTLIYGGGALAKGATKLFGVGEKVAGKVGLFSNSFITQVGGSYEEAITSGLTGGEALGYGMLSATLQSGLELVSPNEVLLGKGGGITKELIKNACKSGSKESLKMVGKTFLKNVGLEIGEENIQETLQLATGNLINMVANGIYGSEFKVDGSRKNFASTAIITTLTTGITTGTSTGVQMNEMSKENKTKLIGYIKSDKGIYQEVTSMLDKAIEGKVSIPNTNIQELQELKLLLIGESSGNSENVEGAENNQENTETSRTENNQENTEISGTENNQENTETSGTENKQDDTETTGTDNNTEELLNYEIKISPEIEQISQILGSRFHEERRQSRLQSDGTYAPRVEKTSDQTRISEHNGQTEVDIANTPFEELPSDWKSENLEAAKVAVGLVYDRVKNGEKVTPEMIEKMAEIVHNKRLERNGTEGSYENQRVSYEQLSEIEKEKDRNQVLRAIRIVKENNEIDSTNQESHQFEVIDNQARSNNEDTDKINEENNNDKLEIQFEGFTNEEIKYLKKLLDIGVGINEIDIEQLLELNLTEENFNYLKKIREPLNELGIEIGSRNLETLLNLNLTEEDFNYLKKIKEPLNELGIDIRFRNMKSLLELNLTDEKLNEIKEKSKKIISSGFKLTIPDIEILLNLDEKHMEELARKIDCLNSIGYKDIARSVEELLEFNLTEESFEEMKEKIKLLNELGMQNLTNNIEELFELNLTEKLFEEIKQKTKSLNELGIQNLNRSIKDIIELELTKEDFDNLKWIKDLGINIDAENIIGISKQLPNLRGNGIDLENILLFDNSVNHNDTQNEYGYATEEIKAHEYNTTGRIIEKIQTYIQNSIKENREIGCIEIVNNIRSDLIFLPISKRSEIVNQILNIVYKFNIINKYLDFTNGPYKTPKELLCAIRGIKDPKIIASITDDITVNKIGAGIEFYVGDDSSYFKIYGVGTPGGFTSGGFNTKDSNINELKGTLCVINGKKSKSKNTSVHEGQHNRNSYFMPDKNGEGATRAKDEITAHLREGKKIEDIEKELTEYGLYQYYQGEEWENHKNLVRELCSYANDLINLSKQSKTGLEEEEIINLLANTPVDGRKDLHSIIMEAENIHNQNNSSQEKVKNLKQRLIDKIKERAGNNELINKLINRRNKKFTNYHIHLDAFRRAGTAKKETEINEILKAENIEDAKHILNDPKYSHIGRGFNNKGGIEISAIIDEVIAGKTDIESIPEEIRNKIQTLITKGNSNNNYVNGKSNNEGLIFDSKHVTQKDAGIYRFNTEETTNTQKNKPGYQSLQKAEQSLNDQIDGKYDKKLYQESFTKKYKNEDFEEDVDDFIKYATEKEVNHKQIFLDLAKEASAKALFIGGPKKKDRIIEKVRNEILKEGEGLEALTDFTRATILFDNFSDFEGGLKVLEQMKNEGRILDLKIRNRLTRPGCNDIFVNIQTPDGYVSEVQFHIPEVLVFRDEKLGDLSIDRYKSDDNILDKHTLTKDIFDLSNDKYKRNLDAYNKIIDRLNEGRDKDHLLYLPKEQDQIVYDHDMYDIIRVLEVYENVDNLTLEDYELFTSKGFKHENIKDLLNDLRLMKENLCNEALNRYRTRTK